MAEPKSESPAVAATSSAKRAFPGKNILRKLVPIFLLKQRSIISNLGLGAGWTYARLWLRDAVGIRESSPRRIPTTSRSLAFVCYGNIMRSPMAEALMIRALQGAGRRQTIEVASAGLHAKAGREAHPWALEAASAMGISLASHRAKLLTKEMVDHADCIFAMDFQNKAELLTLYPEAANKIYMLSAYAEGRQRDREIADPYLGDLDVTKSCYRELDTCIRNLAASIFRTLPRQSE